MREGEREKHLCKTDTSIGCLPPASWPGLGIEPAIQVCALDLESNQRPFGAQPGALTTKHHEPGQPGRRSAF